VLLQSSDAAPYKTVDLVACMSTKPLWHGYRCRYAGPLTSWVAAFLLPFIMSYIILSFLMLSMLLQWSAAAGG
jgi:hypothetical protein